MADNLSRQVEDLQALPAYEGSRAHNHVGMNHGGFSCFITITCCATCWNTVCVGTLAA